jgi:PGF-CTERM protein
MRTTVVVLITLLVVASGVVPAAAAASTQQETSAYAGTNISFETTSNAIVDYRVGDDTVIESMAVQSQSSSESGGSVSVGTDVTAVTNLSAVAVSLDSQTDLGATITTDSGATIEAHDNEKGILVVKSGGNSQYVTVDVADSTAVSSESDKRVAVTTASGTEGAFVVAGDGTVAVTGQGNVSANLTDDSSLVFRSYPDGRDDDDRQQERLIANGTAAAEVTVMQASEGSSDLAADIAQYSQDTTVAVTQTAAGTVNMTATRSQEQGRVIITSVSERAISATDDLQVTIDGEAAVQASSYSELETATNGGETSKFLVRQQSDAEASADVLVALNHFSSRDISLQSSSDGTTNGDESATASSGSGPGFGAVGVLLAVVAATAMAIRRNE